MSGERLPRGSVAGPVRVPVRVRIGVLVGSASGVALLALVAALVVVGSAPGAVPSGLQDAGAAVRWGVPVGRLVLDVCAVLTVGALLVAAVLHPAATHARRLAAWGAGLWATTAVLVAAGSAWEVTGLPPDRLPLGELVRAVTVLPPARALLLVAVLATPAALVAGRSRAPSAAPVALGLAVVALTPTLYVGHSAHLADDRTATGALVVHVVAATVWLGGLAGLAVLVRPFDPELPAAVERFSTLALGAYAALVASGTLVALAGLGTARSSWSSGYAALVGVKVALVVVLGAVGWAHRRWTIGRLRAGRPRAFVRLAAAELVLMGVALGSAVALSRTPGATAGGLPPVPRGSLAAGGDLAGLVAAWRPEPVVGTAVVLGVVVLVRGALAETAGRRGASGSRPRAVPQAAVLGPLAGGLVALAVLGLPVADAVGPLVGALAVQHLVLLLVVPALAVAGRGRDSRLRSAPGADPTAGLAALVGVVLVVAVGPVRDVVASTPAAHVASLAVALVGGVVLHRAVLERAAGAREPVLVLAVLVLAAAGVVVGVTGAPRDLTAPGLVGTAGAGALADPLLAAGLLCAAAVVLGTVAQLALAGLRHVPNAGARPGGGRSG